MRIAFTGLELPAGKRKYNDERFDSLVEKFKPAKVSPYYFEFLADDYASADIIAIAKDRILDLLILDIEKVEARLTRTGDAAETAALRKCLAQLEDQKPVCDLAMEDAERALVKALQPLSLTPTLVVDEPAPDADAVCRAGMEKAGMMFFYTVGKQEVHAWLVAKGADAVTCAGKIHTDLARGFIKADVVSCEDMMKAHNLQDARAKGLVRLVDRDAVIPVNSIIEIRFNV